MCAFSRDGQDTVTPAVITPLLSSPHPSPLFFSPILLVVFFWDRSPVHHGHMNAFSNIYIFFYITSDLHRHFGANSAVLFKETEPRHMFSFPVRWPDRLPCTVRVGVRRLPSFKGAATFRLYVMIFNYYSLTRIDIFKFVPTQRIAKIWPVVRRQTPTTLEWNNTPVKIQQYW